MKGMYMYVFDFLLLGTHRCTLGDSPPLARRAAHRRSPALKPPKEQA